MSRSGHRLSDYEYDLPHELIAQEPLARRDAARLMILRYPSGEIEHRRFSEVPELLSAGDLLITNDTRVNARRLIGRRDSGGAVEALVLGLTSEGAYEALLRPGRRIRADESVTFEGGVRAIVEPQGDGALRRLRFEAGIDLSVFGAAPLPPYIRVPLPDETRYDTVYATRPGSAAAPTAGLHFTPEILSRLEARGIARESVTLHVGLDTFRPVEVEELENHAMHGEEATVLPAVAEAIGRARRVIAVGTTSVRTLESFAAPDGGIASGTRRTRLFIRPGHTFRAVDAMFTNFHLPRTTMLAMISALAGLENIRAAYREAISERYRFLSFGDSMLILPDGIEAGGRRG